MLVTVSALALQVFLGGVEDWGAESFSAPAEQLQRAALAKPTEDGVTWLYRSVRWSVDGQKQVKRTVREVLVVRGADAVDRWSTLSLAYSPEFDQPPVIRARVVTPDGRAYTLSPDQVHDVAPKPEPTLVSDDRNVQAALPGVRSGAVIELELTYATVKPHFPGAQAGRQFFSNRPVRDVRLEFEVPRGVPFAVSTGAVPLTRKDADVGAVHRVVLEGTDVAVPEDVEAKASQVTWTTGASWQAIARGYLAMLERVRKEPAPVDVAALVRGAATRLERAQRLVDWLHREVRYTGVVFGERSHVPWAPAEVARRGYGDCKDMALLLVDLLGRAGVDARIALLDTDGMLDPKTPALSFFDHAIVFVPASKSEPALWVDATASHTPAGLLPSRYAGEDALVIDDATTALVPTWAPTQKDSERRLLVEVDLPSYGAGTARVTQTLTGLFAAWARGGMDEEGPKWMEIEAKTLGRLVGAGPLEQTFAPSKNAAEPVVYGGQVGGLDDWFSDYGATQLYMPEQVALAWLPEALTDEEPPELSQGRLDHAVPHVSTLTVRVRPPPGFVVTESPPTEQKVRFGPALLTRTVKRLPDGVVELSSRFETGPRRYTAAQVSAFRQEYAKWNRATLPALRLVFEADVLEKQQKVTELLAWYRRQRASQPDEVGIEARYAGHLLLLGLGDAARAKTRAAVEKYPQSALAWLLRGWVLSHDVTGASLEPGFERKDAVAALQRALELEPACRYCLERIADLERCDDEGGWLTAKVDARRATAAFAAAWPKDRSSSRWVELMTFVGDWAALKASLDSPSTAAEREAALLASQMVDGAPAAWKRWSGRMNAEDLKKAVTDALLRHLKHDRIGEAIELARAAGRPDDVAAFDQLVKGRAGKLRVDAERRTLWTVYDALLTGDATRRARVMKDDLLELPGGATVREFADQLEWGVIGVSRATGLPRRLLVDGLYTNAPARLDRAGDDGRRLAVSYGKLSAGLFLVRQDGRWRVLAVTSSRDVANQALQLFKKGRADEARTWLDWARAAWSQARLPYQEAIDVVASAWPEKPQYLAAAMVPRSPIARTVLEAALDEAPGKVKVAVLRLLAYGAAASQQWSEASGWIDRLEALDPDDPETLAFRAWERGGAGDVDAHEQACAHWLERAPQDLSARRCLAGCAEKRGDDERALQLWKEIVSTKQATAGDFNSAAWRALFVKSPPAEMVTWAAKATEGKDAPWAYRHTQAVVLATTGKDWPRTREVLRGLGYATSQPSLALVPARIAQGLGLAAEAGELYRQVINTAKDDSARLSARWLEDLERPAAGH